MAQYKYKEAKYTKYFFNEIKPFIDETLIPIYTKELPENFEESIENGENEDIISQLIRNDSIEEFKNFFNQNNVSLTS